MPNELHDSTLSVLKHVTRRGTLVMAALLLTAVFILGLGFANQTTALGQTGSMAQLDINEDGFVDLLDLSIVVTNFDASPVKQPRADVNFDGAVDIRDLALVARSLWRLVHKPLRAMGVERAFPNLMFQQLTGFVQPDDGQSHLLVTEQAGRILVFPDLEQATQADIFLDIRNRVSDANNEEGLLGLAFDPDYKNSGHFYVYYSTANPTRSVISRFSVSLDDPNLADTTSEFVIIEIAQPFGNHNGGQLAFGPDGHLYVALGDGGSGGDPRGHGQNSATLLGSLLRIDVSGTSIDRNYRIPSDNPFVGVAGAKDEIWAFGFRNPWRFSFDQRTGALWLADVGQNRFEEVDIVRKGLNYGWNTMEAGHCFSPSTECNETGLELPVWEYSLSDGNCAVTGGHVFYGRGLPSLLGAYVYGDFCSGKIWGLRYDGDAVTEQMLLIDSDLFITSFGQDLAGNLYILSRNDGIYRLVPTE